MPDGSYERRRRRRRDVGSFITSFNLRCAMFSGSLIAATPPVDRQEKSSYADKDSPERPPGFFLRVSFSHVAPRTDALSSSKSQSCEGSFKVDVQTVPRKFNSRFQIPLANL